MRDIIFIFLVGVAILLMAMLACHISRCYDLGKNWFTTPLFGQFAHNAGLINRVQTDFSLLWIA